MASPPFGIDLPTALLFDCSWGGRTPKHYTSSDKFLQYLKFDLKKYIELKP